MDLRETRRRMSGVESDLRSHVDSFVDELSALIRRQALQVVGELLENGHGAPAVASRRLGRPPKATATAAQPMSHAGSRAAVRRARDSELV